jgi:hypothetical protein
MTERQPRSIRHHLFGFGAEQAIGTLTYRTADIQYSLRIGKLMNWIAYVQNNVQDSLCTVQLTDRKNNVQDRLRIGLMIYSTADVQDW